MAAMSSNPQTSLAGGAAALLLALFAFLGPEPISWPRAAVLVAGCFAIAALGIFARDASRTADPPNPDRSPVGPSVDVLERVRRGELSPEDGARALEVGRERGVVAPAFAPPNARGDK